MIDIFTEYAQLAFEVGKADEKRKSPPKPKMPLRQMIAEMPPEFDVREAVDHFIRDHLVGEDRMVEAREQFEKLYDSGVFLFEGIIDYESTEQDVLVGIRLLVWNGIEHVDANVLLADEEEAEPCYEENEDDYPVE